MKKWTEIVECKLEEQKNNIAKISLRKVTVSYSEKVKQNRVLKAWHRSVLTKKLARSSNQNPNIYL